MHHRSNPTGQPRSSSTCPCELDSSTRCPNYIDQCCIPNNRKSKYQIAAPGYQLGTPRLAVPGAPPRESMCQNIAQARCLTEHLHFDSTTQQMMQKRGLRPAGVFQFRLPYKCLRKALRKSLLQRRAALGKTSLHTLCPECQFGPRSSCKILYAPSNV